MRAFIRLGDKTDHGGEVVTATGPQVYGKKVALVDDKVMCPVQGHGVNAILPGQTRIRIGGKLAALHGFKTECGCTLIASLQNAGEG